MGFEKHYEARAVVEDFFRKDLLGPVREDEVITDTWPSDYYITGILFPQGMALNQEQKEKDILEDELDSNDLPMSLCYATYPSSMAISFSVRPEIEKVSVDVSFARYLPTEKEGQKRGKKKYDWQRVADTKTYSVLTDGSNPPVYPAENLELRVYLQKKYLDGSKTLTIALVNCNKAQMDLMTNNINAFFQAEIRIRGEKDGQGAFIAKKLKISMGKDPEIINLDMLYKHNREFAVGHGCSAGWKYTGDHTSEIYTEYIPSFEILQMKPALRIGKEIRKFHFLGFGAKMDICKALKEMTVSYHNWIDEQSVAIAGIPLRYHDVANENMKKCKESLERISEGIDKLAGDTFAFQAFQLANQAMFRLYEEREGSSKAKERDWYPFQLAFILQELASIVDESHEFRDVVDLLWFPTGGGKTEAYLGLTAFTIFLRRLKATRESRTGAGVTVVMRYTLRLLTLDQFERAAALICSCELIRRDMPEVLGQEEIAAGLWVGTGLTPNKRDKALTTLNKIKSSGLPALDKDEANPCQILKCPWCGGAVNARDYDLSGNRMIIRCPNTGCKFQTGIPIYVVDEDIYDYGPSLVIGTVDKYARMAWEKRTGRLFGLNSEWLPPELIIQDELHLISGPLGTVAGLYEVAVDQLCQYNNIRPKIISSTATIRNAGGQILSLYGRGFRQFPPQGIDIRDSYFAEESKRNERPARRYLGLLAPSASGNTRLIRVYSILIFATRYLVELGYTPEVVDSFWTLTGYFNSLKQLGSAVINVIDDVNGRLKYLYGTKFAGLFPSEPYFLEGLHFDELTSRKDNSEIGETREHLKVGYPDDSAFDLILASNMLSVGIDIGRLGLMVVQGQPKLNSEYIQATSRVGRQTPGLVIGMYDATRSRDRSHYEQFTAYHSSLYKYVEATSLTPFAERARDRALHAVFVIMCRHLIPGLLNNEDAGNISVLRSKAEEQIQKILDRVNVVDKTEYKDTMERLSWILEQWEDIASTDLIYQKHPKARGIPLLTERFDVDRQPPFPTLNSMRNVDVESEVTLEG